MPDMSVKNIKGNIFLRMHPLHRILISLILTILTFVIARGSEISNLMVSMLLWDVFAFTYILTSWIVFFTCSTEQIRKEASKEDGSRIFVFLVILISSFASMLNVLLLIINKNETNSSISVLLPLAIVGMVLSWIIVHTTFGFHYAHKYYNDDIAESGKHAEGLSFPNEKKPDYLDFAYFSFVIGMTFQVSDVQVTSPLMRRIVLFHGLLSFGLSVFVLALTINIIAGLIH
jgi:uncharacterized membrane protein